MMLPHDLDDLAFGLRTGSLSLRDAVLSLEAYPSLLRTFACDCAERVIWRMSREEVQLEEPEHQAIETARFFSEGDGCERSLAEAFEGVSDPWHRRSSLFFSLGYDTKLIERSNVGWVTLKDAVGAAWGALLHSDEPAWQRGRLAWLCEIWEICGERTPFLLREQQMPLEEPQELRIRP